MTVRSVIHMKKKLKILLVIFLILGVAVLLDLNMSRTDSVDTSRPLVKATLHDIDSFAVNNFTMGLLFKKSGEAWQVKLEPNALTLDLQKKAGAPIEGTQSEFVEANPVAIAKALTELTEQKIDKPIAALHQKPAAFEINEFSLHVILYDKEGQELDRVWIGKHGPDLFTNFVKKKDSDDVYLVRQNLRDLFLVPLEGWLSNSKGAHDGAKK